MTPRWLGLYLLLIGALTLFPYSPPTCRDSQWTFALLAGDFLMNTLLFVPLGIALYRGALKRTVAAALVLSFVIEFSQQWLPRSPDVADLASNTLGAIIGHALARTWSTDTPAALMSRTTERVLVRSFAALLLVSTLGGAALKPASDFSNWRSVPLMIGNEPRGDRGWVGEVLELSIYDHALPPELEPSARAMRAHEPWTNGGPVLALDIAETTSVRLDGPDGPMRQTVDFAYETGITNTANALHFSPIGLAFDLAVGNHVFERLRATGQLTIDARIHPHSARWHGLRGSILSFGDAGGFNLLLAQYDGILQSRIRTPSTVVAGQDLQLETRWNALKGGEQHVRITYDGYDAKMFVDGVCLADSDLSIVTAPLLLGAALGGTLVLCCALAALAIGSFYDRAAARLTRGIGAGILAWITLYLFGTWDHVAGFDIAAFCLGLLSLAATVPLLTAERLVPHGPPPDSLPPGSPTGATTIV